MLSVKPGGALIMRADRHTNVSGGNVDALSGDETATERANAVRTMEFIDGRNQAVVGLEASR
jgi:hypothetical protein